MGIVGRPQGKARHEQLVLNNFLRMSKKTHGYPKDIREKPSIYLKMLKAFLELFPDATSSSGTISMEAVRRGAARRIANHIRMRNDASELGL